MKMESQPNNTMESEMDSLKANGVYEIVDRLAGKKVVKSKWVFRVKTNELGEVEKSKARVSQSGIQSGGGGRLRPNF